MGKRYSVYLLTMYEIFTQNDSSSTFSSLIKLKISIKFKAIKILKDVCLLFKYNVRYIKMPQMESVVSILL